MTNYAYIPNISVRYPTGTPSAYNALRLLARNSLQGTQERQSGVFQGDVFDPSLN